MTQDEHDGNGQARATAEAVTASAVVDREATASANGVDRGDGAAAAQAATAAPRPTKPTCSVIIPVHNKASLTRQCLNTILAQDETALEREIVVVDDASIDLTQRLLAAYGDRVRVVTHATARGFAGACHAGAAAATGEYLVFLNNDTLPLPNWLTTLVRYAEEHPRAAVVGAKLVYPNDTIQHAGVVFGQNRFPHHIYAGFPANHPAPNKSRPFQAVTAACWLIRRGPWEEMGGFDTSFVNGWEDVDLCLQLGEAGHEVHYCHESVVYHMESSTRDLRAPQERENRERFAAKWRDRIVPDDLNYYIADGLIAIEYGARYPMHFSISPLIAGVTIGDAERAGDRLLAERAKQVAILLRNNIVLNTRVQEAEMRAQAAELRAREAERRLAAVPAAALAPDPDAAAVPDEPPPAPAAPVAKILGTVERPGRVPEVVTEDFMLVSGWALSPAGIWKVETLVDGAPLGEIEYGLPRPDAAALHRGFPDGENCGFQGTIPVTGLVDGDHSLTIRIVAKDGRHAELSTAFEVDSSAQRKARVLVRCDRPTPGGRNVVRDRLPVVGWALSPYGIRVVDTFVDGEPLGHVAYGALRPDVAMSHPNYPNSDHSGFSGSVPVSGLADGEHTLLLRVTAFDEQQVEIEVPFEVDSTAIAIGEVPHVNLQYPAWLRKHTPTADDLARARAEAAALPARPLIGLVSLLGQAEAGAVSDLIGSLRAQVYDNWRLSLVADAATGDDVRAVVNSLAAADPRITFVPSPADAGAAGTGRCSLETADGDWVAFVPPADLLSPLALFEVARALNDDPEADVVYVDEDKIDPEVGLRWDPYFKPDWSPDLLLSTNYLGPFTLYRRSLLDQVGGYRPDLVGSEAYDLALRATERTGRVVHVPKLLYSRRTSSIGGGIEASERAHLETARRALSEAVARRGLRATVEEGVAPGRWRVRYELGERPPVTILMPSGGKMQFLRPCLEDILAKSTYPNLHVLILDNSDGTAVAEFCDELAAAHPNLPLRREPITLKPFNFSALINHGVPLVETPYLILLNDDITVITPDWVEAMLEHAQRPEVGAVGARLLFPDQTIQHAGVILGPYEGTGHAFKQFSADYTGFFGLPTVIRNLSAVTFACAMLRRSIFDEVGGLDAEHLPIAFNDVDMCLRIVEAGYRIVYTPHAELYHHESVTKKVIAQPSEIGHLRSRWGHVIAHDPFYNPNLTRRAEDCSLNMD